MNDLLAQGELSLHGRLVAASNGTFQVEVRNLRASLPAR